ncbi:glycosyltransferase family 4 protein [Oceanicella actignis]|uniref:Glycosyltransferase involved in cell wall bisynthesis n=1 Tax=Oceanicella actignis TaxID=1189325 RepID=A0A1M7T520_9RHOB|nr:glycosyltransferase family 4 protein [Oceanicella actignis]SET42500.1 Glycosyltransferase involved in cell wall bisynthesis [Oceanicella actignis]SHN65791.1 Glycosyltransferase involved in cell wall bisynthesis [Oceanicella actignis]
MKDDAHAADKADAPPRPDAAADPAADPAAARGLRVAYLVNQYPKVSHTFIRREIQALERLGVRVDRYALRGWDNPTPDPSDAEECARTRHLLRRGPAPLAAAALRVALRRPRRFARALGAALAMGRRGMRPLPYHLAYLAHACRLLELLRDAPVAHLHAHFGTNAAEVALLLRLLGGPRYSFTVHGSDEFDHADGLALDRKIAGAAFVAAISAYTRAQLMRRAAPEHWPRIQVVRCGLEDAFFADDPAPFPERPHLLCIGRFCVEKGQPILLDAFAAVARAHPDARLILAGDGEMRPLIERRIAELGLNARATITGWISSDQVRDLIRASTAVVQPSLMEGLPVVLMEAMAQRRPVISTWIAGIPELVVDGENGWLVPAGDAEAAARAIDACLSAPPERLARMAEAGFARVRARHAIDAEAARLAELFAQST